MKHGCSLSRILLVLALIGLTGRFFSWLAPRVACFKPLRACRIAVTLNPLDDENLRMLGMAWLDRGDTQKGLLWLNRSLEQNPLSPETWKTLGQTHLTDPVLRQTHFERGIAELRTAARLGPGRPGLSLSVGLELLRLWPLLDEGARDECRLRLSRGIHYMVPDQVDAFTRDWYRYSRSWELLAAVLETCPEACEQVAQRLIELGAPLKWRWRLLEAAERRAYAVIRTRFDEARKQGLTVDKLEEMIGQVERFSGYSRLVDRENKDWERFQVFRESLILLALQRSIRRYRIHSGESQREEVSVWIERAVNQTHVIELADLPRRLEELGFWRSIDTQSRELRVFLDMRNGNHTAALSGAQELLNTVDGVDAQRVGLLAVRAAMAVRLMTSAQKFAAAVLARDPGNLEALWRRVQISRFLREDVDDEDLKRLGAAAILNLVDKEVEGIVPLLEGVRAGVNVTASSIGSKRLLQVYVDGAIFLEKYLEPEAQIVWLDLPVPEELDSMPIVRAKILDIMPSSE